MGEVVLLSGGSLFFDDDYTATAPDVIQGKKFLGRGSNDIQIGTKPVISPAEQKLSINGTYNIQAGYHNAAQKIYQEIPTKGAQTVTPAGNGQIISISGNYMSGNVTLNALENFDPVNIKKGVTVGTGDQAITGNYEGFE